MPATGALPLTQEYVTLAGVLVTVVHVEPLSVAPVGQV